MEGSTTAWDLTWIPFHLDYNSQESRNSKIDFGSLKPAKIRLQDGENEVLTQGLYLSQVVLLLVLFIFLNIYFSKSLINI